MHFDNPFGDGQAQAGSTLFTRAGFIGSPESIEDVWNIGFRNSNPRVRYGNEGELLIGLKVHSYGAIPRSELHSIVKQDQQRPTQCSTVCLNPHWRTRQASR